MPYGEEERIELTPEERELIIKIGDKASEIYWLTTLFYPTIDSKRVGPKIMEKLKELKDLLSKIKFREMV